MGCSKQRRLRELSTGWTVAPLDVALGALSELRIVNIVPICNVINRGGSTIGGPAWPGSFVYHSASISKEHSISLFFDFPFVLDFTVVARVRPTSRQAHLFAIKWLERITTEFAVPGAA